MNFSQAKQIKIPDFLNSIGVQPDDNRRSNSILLYKSPFRIEQNASLEVDTSRNIWFDHGEGIGGNIIDLVMKLKQLEAKEALHFLDQQSGTIKPFSFYQQNKFEKPGSFRGIKITSVKPLRNLTLIAYVNKRQISLSLASLYLQQVHFKIWSVKRSCYVKLIALGFKNDKLGFELRNSTFQGCNSKHFTLISGKQNDHLNVFEGFFDFLSAAQLNNTRQLKYDSLVLNSVALKEKTVPVIQKYAGINLFLDNDTAGRKAVEFYKVNHSKVKDYSQSLYPDHKDLNNYHIELNSKDHED